MQDHPIVEAGQRGMSLSAKLSLGLVTIIAILFAGLNGWNIYTHRMQLLDDAQNQSVTVARVIASTLVPELANNDVGSEPVRATFQNALSAAMQASQKERELAAVAIVDASGAVLAGRARPELTLFAGGVVHKSEEQVLDKLAAPDVKLGANMRAVRFPLQKGGAVVARLIVVTSFADIIRAANRDLAVNFGALVIALAVLMLYARVALARMVIAPLTQVVDAMRAVQQGDLEHELDLRRGDELGVLASTYNYMVRGLRERVKLQDAFARYVSPQVYERFQRGTINLSGETRNATVLFSDIRSFTTLSEQLTPPEVVAMLNEYFTDMVEIVFKHDGFLNKFIGDAIMAIYNVPLDQPDPELKAVLTGLEMIEALERLNQRRLARGQFALKIGIGINTGPVVAGNLGHERRLEYTVIGDTVNLAQRLESQTKVAGVPLLVSASTYAACARHVTALELPSVKVKGKAEAIVTYAITGLAGQPPIVSLAHAPAPAAHPSGAHTAVRPAAARDTADDTTRIDRRAATADTAEVASPAGDATKVDRRATVVSDHTHVDRKRPVS